MVDWDAFMTDLASFPPGVHDLFPPCPLERIGEVERSLGRLPSDLMELFKRFNGGTLFNKSMQLLTIFGLWMPYETVGFEYLEEAGWFVEGITPRWRSSAERASDWVFGITNWGGLQVMGADLLVRVWDTAEGGWLLDSPARSLDKWAADLLAEGAEYLEET